MRRRAGLVLVALLAALLGAVPVAPAQTAHMSIVGGGRIPVTSAPWQVYLAVGSNLACGGSVLDATHVLTAAHCIVPEGRTTPRPTTDFTVWAGFDSLRAAPPSGSQKVAVAGLRVHPYYEAQAKADDVAVLTLASALTFNARVQPVGLAPIGGGPAPGAVLGFSGFGTQQQGVLPNGMLYGAALGAISDLQCRAAASPNATASIQCVAPGPSAPCFADSGGPLTAGGLQVGVSSYAPPAGCGQGPSGFADVTVPEVRAFIDGSDTPPAAPRQSTPTLIYALPTPVVGSPITCAPGTWAGAAALGYTFLDEATGAALQSGASASYTPPAEAQGATISCIVTASSAGGTSTAWSGVAATLQADVVRPRATLRSVRCRKRRCTVKLVAADANSQGALKVRVTAERRVRGRCGKRKRRCHKTRARSLKVKHTSGTAYKATSRRKLKRGRTVLRVRVVDAAGNRMKPDLKRRVRIRSAP